MRILIYILSLILIMLFGFGINAYAGDVTTTYPPIDQLVSICGGADEKTTVYIKTNSNEEKACYCCCMDNIWVCTSNECKEDDKTCENEN